MGEHFSIITRSLRVKMYDIFHICIEFVWLYLRDFIVIYSVYIYISYIIYMIYCLSCIVFIKCWKWYLMIFHGLWWSWFYLLFFVHVWGDPVFEEIRLWRFFINCTTQMRGLRAPSLQTNATGGGRGWPGSGLSSTREKLVPRDWLTIGDRHQFLEQILDLVGKIMVAFFLNFSL